MRIAVGDALGTMIGPVEVADFGASVTFFLGRVTVGADITISVFGVKVGTDDIVGTEDGA